MKKAVRKPGCMVAIAVAVSTVAPAFHYYARLRLLEHKVVVIQPGKWGWVECQTKEFSATIDEVTISGILASVAASSPKGLPCEAIGIAASREHEYFLPFQTLLGVRVGNQEKWSK